MSLAQQLIEMGFDEQKVHKALDATGGNDIEQAMEWLLSHVDDPPITEGEDRTLERSSVDAVSENEDKACCGEGDIKTEANKETDDPDAIAKSIKCDECGKLFKSNEEVEFHAVKSGHSSFSESTEEKKALTEEEKKEKLKDLEGRLRQRRKEKEEEDEKVALEREKKRLQMGREIAEAKRKLQEEEIRRMAEERRREKQEDKIARQKVKEQIERDRQARKEKIAQSQVQANPVAAQPAVIKPAQKKDYTTSKIQVRFSNGSTMVHEFHCKEALSAVRLWISLNRTDGKTPDTPFQIATTFPRRIFSQEDMEKPLNSLGLVPSAVIVVNDG